MEIVFGLVVMVIAWICFNFIYNLLLNSKSKVVDTAIKVGAAAVVYSEVKKHLDKK
jgi:hypothetical protein